MKSITAILSAALLFLLILVGLQASFLLADLSEGISETRIELARQSDEAAQTQAQARESLRDAAAEVAVLRLHIEDELGLTRQMAELYLRAALQLADARLAETNRILLFTSQSGLRTVGAAQANFASVSNETVALERQIGAEVAGIHAEFLDCEGLGQACLQNRIFNTTAALQKLSEDLAAAQGPLVASAQANSENVEKITGDIGTLTGRLTAKRGFWGKMFDGAKIIFLLGTRLVL